MQYRLTIDIFCHVEQTSNAGKALAEQRAFARCKVAVRDGGLARAVTHYADHPSPHLIIVEDDGVIARGMARHLESAGFDAVAVASGETGLARLRYERPDVCVLDLMLPGVDGWRVIEQARAEGIGTPIVVVSARGTEHDRVHALEIGADDYLVKPFSMKELAARVGAAARRGVSEAEPRRGDRIDCRGDRAVSR